MARKDDEVILSVRVPRGDLRVIDQLAGARGVSRSDVLRVLLGSGALAIAAQAAAAQDMSAAGRAS